MLLLEVRLRLRSHVEAKRILVEGLSVHRGHLLVEAHLMLHSHGWAKGGCKVELLKRSLLLQVVLLIRSSLHTTELLLLQHVLQHDSLALFVHVHHVRIEGAFVAARFFNLVLSLFHSLNLASAGSSDGAHLNHELCFVALEVLVTEDDWIIGANTTVDLTEAPSVELTSVGRELGGLEELRQDVASKFFGVADDEALAIKKPCDAEGFGIFLFSQMHHGHQLLNFEIGVRVSQFQGWSVDITSLYQDILP